MATITWTGAAGDGNFNNPANWSPQQVPGAGDNAVITPSVATTISAPNDAVGTLTTSSKVLLEIPNGSSFAIGNAGTITTVKNAGTIALQSAGYGTPLVFDASKTTLTGAGTIAMSDNGNNYIEGGSAADVLTNVNNTIEGAGQLGNGRLTLANEAAGKIIAEGNNALVLNTGSIAVSNAGLFESFGAGGLVIESVVNNGSAGVVSAAGGNVYLQGGVIAGGTLLTSGGAEIIENSSGELDGSAVSVINDGTVVVDQGTALTLLGTIGNAGTILLQSFGYGTDLTIGPGGSTPGTVTLTGGGNVVLTDNGNNAIAAAISGDTLINLNNMISGAGQIGPGALVLVNDSTIDATGGNALTIDNGNVVTNDGLIEATNSGGLTINNATTIDNTGGGTVLAAGGNVFLNGATLRGGTLNSTAGFSIVEAGTATLDGSTQAVTNLGAVALDQGTALTLLGTIDNSGTIGLQSAGYGTNLIIGSPTVTLTGNGSVVLTDNASNAIYGASAADTLVNLNNTISGAGQIGAAQLTLVNDATIDATGANALTINTGNTVVNDGLMEATNTGGLSISGSTTIDSSGGGTLLATGGNIYLSTSTLAGGTLDSGNGYAVVDTSGATLDGSAHTLTNLGAVVIDQGTALTLLGTIDNIGTIGVQSAGYGTDLIVGSPTVTLTGNGSVVLTDNPNNAIYGASVSDTLVNLNNTISGAGQIGAAQLTLINDATIDATGANALTINTGHTVVNDGLMEATNTGGLSISGSTTIDSSGGGTLLATGGDIYLSNSTLAGGTLNSGNGYAVVDTSGSTLDGSAHTLTNLGAVVIDQGTALTLLGTIDNIGTIGVQSAGYGTDLIIGSPTVTLTGGGTVTMSDNGNNYIYGAATADVLKNVNNTIAGAGQLGDGQLTLVNGGTIEATGANALTVNLGSTGTNTSTGSMLGIGSGGLSISNGTYTNSGLIEAQNGSSVTFQSNVTLTNDSSKGILTRGTYGAVSTGGGATLTLGGAAITTNAANIILSGVGSAITAGGKSVDSSLLSIGATGEMQVLNGRDFIAKASLTDKGLIVLGNGTLTAKVLTVAVGATISGNGTIAASLHDSGTITATGGALLVHGMGTISGVVNGTGTLTLEGLTTTLAAGVALGVSNIAMINHATLKLATNVSFGGIFDIVGGGTIATASGNGITNQGLFEQTGTGTSTVSAPFDNAGTITITAGGTIDFTGGLANTGTIIDNGGFTTNAALTGGTLEIGASPAAASLAGSGSTLAVLDMAGGTLNTNGSIVTVTGDYDNTAARTGNSYNPFAGVTGTIDGQGTHLAVVGVNGTTITDLNGTPTIMIAPHGTAQFVIENTGAAGSADLRGALQTTVNGGNITGHALTGSGVTAQNFGPITGGGESSVFTISYSSGSLTNQAIHFTSDFANVAGVTVDIAASGAAAAAAPAGGWTPTAPATAPDAVMLSNG